MPLDPISEARKALLEAPEPALLADYLLAMNVGIKAGDTVSIETMKSFLDVMPHDVLHEARQIAERRRVADTKPQDAASDRIQARYSRIARARRRYSPRVVAVLRAPWAVMTVVATWLFVHTCHHPRIEVVTCAWYRNQELTATDSTALRNTLSQLWISKFAIDTLQTLPPACSAELNSGKPSMPCIHETIATLERIALAETEEDATIKRLDGKLQTWCPDVGLDNDPGNDARLLFDKDVISAWLWPPIYFNWSTQPGATQSDVAPSSTHCADGKVGGLVGYERLASRHQLRMYQRLVESIIGSSCKARALLGAYDRVDSPFAPCPEQPQPSSMEGTTYLSLVLHNVGNAPAELDTKGAELRFDGGRCKFERRVKLDPYNHRPGKDLLPDTVSLGPGESLEIDVKTDCTLKSTIQNATLHIKGLATDAAVQMSEQSAG